MTIVPFLLALTITIDVRPDDPAAVVRQFVLAEANGNRAAAAALWVSPDDAFTRRQLRRMETRCARVVETTVAVASSQESVVTLETREVVAVTGGPSSAARLETSHSRFSLKRTGAGWRITGRESLEESLVERLKQANAADRGRILAASPHLQNERFVVLCGELVRELVNERRIDEADDLAGVVDDIARRIGDPAAIAAITSARSIVARNRTPTDVDLGIQLGSEAVSHAETADDADVLARALSRLARAKELVSARFDASLLERALEVADRLEDPSAAAHAAVLLSRQHEREGQVREAFRLAESASRYAEASDDVSAKIIAAQMLGGAYLWNADNELARRHFKRAYDLALAAGYEGVAAQALASLASTLDAAGGAVLIEQGFKQFRPELVMPLLWWTIWHHLAAGRPDEAERDLRKLMEIAPTDETTARGIALQFVSIRLAQQRYAEAADYVAQAKRFTTSSEDYTAELEARVLRCLGRGGEAVDKMEELLATAWSPDNSIADPSAAPFVESMGAPEEFLVELHVEQGNVLRALEVSETVKARGLHHALVKGGVAPSVMSEADRQRERNLEARIEELNRALIAARDEKQSAALSSDVDHARSDLLDFRQRVLAAEPFRDGGAAVPWRVDDLPASLDDVTILSYTQTRDQLFVFLIAPKTLGRRAVSARTLPIGSEATRQKVARLTSFMDDRNLRADDVGKELFALLVAPFEEELLQARRLCIIPHRALWRLPFHALIGTTGRRLIDHVPVFYAPSVAVLALAEARRPAHWSSRPTLLAFANPVVGEKTASLYRTFDRNASIGAIPEAEWEVRAIAAHYGRKRAHIHIGRQADEGTMKREAPRHDILHIATHGLVQEKAPMFSSLLLSSENEEDDGLLEVREIVELELHADTVVLSACDTGKPDRDHARRDPVVGFSWAFLAAGSRTTVVSQWKAQSAATATLMAEFHRRLAKGASKTEALRDAQLVLRRDPRYRHPFYWAPFIVVGAP